MDSGPLQTHSDGSLCLDLSQPLSSIPIGRGTNVWIG
ncbi:hypothetical protein ES288_A03G069400v1 [Gossypium darwinii]|uniref:Uncharacterized protein n=1 Tax=Gossypium darwinii TaxID=34276 RepID=A0A5D2H1N3_GOSDA|nr:hypothetical protein ES288_A03G069400v1 [Gossypium darwinii]